MLNLFLYMGNGKLTNSGFIFVCTYRLLYPVYYQNSALQEVFAMLNISSEDLQRKNIT